MSLHDLKMAVASVVAVAAASGIAGKTITLRSMSDDARRQLEAFENLRNHPPVHRVVNWSIVAPDLYVALPKSAPPKSPLVVMVGSRRCTFCEQAWTSWIMAGRDVTQNGALAVRYVSLDSTDELPEPLRHTGSGIIAVDAVRVKDVLRFSIRTGVRVIPMTFVFSNAQTLACAVSGVPARETAVTCLRHSTPNTLFYVNSTTRELLSQ